MSEKVTCENCKKEFYVKPSQVRSYRFCGYQCRTEYKTEIRKCVQCGKDFKAYKSQEGKGIYCSKSCATTARNLTDQNPSHTRDLSGPNNPMYGKEGLKGEKNPMYGKKGPLSPRWKDVNVKSISGYKVINVPDDYPNPCFVRTGKKFALEHRVVMEKHIGRYLRPEEVVHHRNADRRDNRIENLTLFANQSDHLKIGHGAR